MEHSAHDAWGQSEMGNFGWNGETNHPAKNQWIKERFQRPKDDQ